MGRQVRDHDKIMLRVPDGLRDRVARAAKAQGRSMNAEIVALLEMYYPPEPTLKELLEQLQIVAGMAKRASDHRWKAELAHLLEEIMHEVIRVDQPDHVGRAGD